jgi:uncharacterized damage-inducible protein DinB
MTRSIIDEFESGGPRLREAVQNLTESELKTRIGPGTWSIHEIVIHLLDSDEIAIDRMKRILIEDNPTQLYADESAYIEKLYPHEQSLDDALTMFEVGRRQFARVLRKLPDAAFDRFGTHNKKGRVTLGQMVQTYVNHVNDHMTFLLGKRERLGKPLSRAHSPN